MSPSLQQDAALMGGEALQEEFEISKTSENELCAEEATPNADDHNGHCAKAETEPRDIMPDVDRSDIDNICIDAQTEEQNEKQDNFVDDHEEHRTNEKTGHRDTLHVEDGSDDAANHVHVHGEKEPQKQDELDDHEDHRATEETEVQGALQVEECSEHVLNQGDLQGDEETQKPDEPADDHEEHRASEETEAQDALQVEEYSEHAANHVDLQGDEETQKPDEPTDEHEELEGNEEIYIQASLQAEALTGNVATSIDIQTETAALAENSEDHRVNEETETMDSVQANGDSVIAAKSIVLQGEEVTEIQDDIVHNQKEDKPVEKVAFAHTDGREDLHSSMLGGLCESKLRKVSKVRDDERVYGGVFSEDHNPSDSEVWTIRLKKRHDSILGMQVAYYGNGSPMVVEAICDGVLQAWNESHPNQEIRRGDQLLRVNGFGEMETMMHECQKSGVLDLEFFRPADGLEFIDYSHLEPSSSSSSSSSSWQGNQNEFDRPYISHSSSSASGSSTVTTSSRTSSQSTSAPSPSSRTVQKKVSDKMSFGLGYVKGRVESTLTAPVQVSVKAQKGLEYVKVRASAASGVMSAQISQTAQKGLKFAKAFGKAGGA